MYKIGIIGYGYVGRAMFEFFKTRYTTIFYDPYVDGSHSKEDINTCDLGVVCVMTPQDPSTGACDTSIVEETIDWLETPLILIKSTIAPGTTDRLKNKTQKRIVFSPEYIGESTYDTGRHNFNKDASKTPFITLGGDSKDVDGIIDIIVPIFGPNKTYHATTALNAEIAKYMENSFLATKLVFAYEFDQICKAFGASYHQVRECWLLDPRMESSHTAVFSTNTKPYDGKCLPKDLAAITYHSAQQGYDPEFIREVQRSNERLGAARAKQNATGCEEDKKETRNRLFGALCVFFGAFRQLKANHLKKNT